MNKKNNFRFFVSLLCFSLTVDCFALPSNHQVLSGSSEFKQIDSHTLEIYPSDQAIINYSKFNIGKREKVKFIQKSTSSCVLNKVSGESTSEIFGSLESNGKVFLVNPNGIYFGPDSSVNVGSLIASTLEISNEDFLQANYKFQLGDKSSNIKNEGVLNSAEGSIALIAPQIQNLGSITARIGNVILTSGEHVTLDFTGDGLIQFSTSGTLKEALIEQLGDISASIVQLKIPAAKKAISEIVNLEGVEEGDIFIEENGLIKFASAASIEANQVLLEAANLEIKGSIDVANYESKGGEVHLFGREISLEGSLINASGKLGGGEVLIGGEYQGKGKTPYASKVTMDQSSQILVNAIESGDGGLAVLWSLNQTQFDGEIQSKGGPLSGHGGRVETSGKINLKIDTGFVDTSASFGSYGNWLLDPYTLCIVADNYSGGSGNCPSAASNSCTDCDTATNCSIKASTFTGASSNVEIQAVFDVFVNTPIVMQNSNVGITFSPCSNTLIGTIFLNSGITTKGSINGSGTSQGGITFTNNGSIPLWVSIASNVTLDTTGSGTTTGADIQALNLTYYLSNTTVTFNAGSTGTVNINSYALAPYSVVVSSAKQVTVGTGGNSGAPGLLTKGGPITIDSSIPLIATGNIKLESSGGAISLGPINGSTSGGQNLSINAGGGSVLFGVVGSGTYGSVLNNFTVSGGTIYQLSSALAAGNISYTGNATDNSVSLSGDITSQSETGTISLAGGITFLDSRTLSANSINASGATVSAVGSLTFECVGSTVPGSVSCGTIDLGSVSSVIVNGFQDIQMSSISLESGSITFPTNSTLTLIGSGITTFLATDTITLGSIAATSSGTQGFQVTLGTGDLTISGTAGNVNSYLSSFEIVSAGTASISSITTLLGPITITPDVTLTSTPQIVSNGGDITFLGQITASQDVTINASSGSIGSVSLQSVDVSGWDFSLIADSIILAGNVAANEISFLATNVTLNDNVTLTSSEEIDLETGFFGTNYNLQISNTGTCTIGTSSNGISLGSGSFIQNGIASVSLAQNISAENITFDSLLILEKSITLTAANELNVNNGVSGNNFNLTLENSGLCTISSTTNSINIGSGIFQQTGSGAVSLSSDVSASSILFNSPITLTNSTTNLTASAGLTLSNTVDGACNLTLDGGFLDVKLEAIFGGTTPLQSLIVTGTSNTAYITGGGIAVDSIDMSSLSRIILQAATNFTVTNGTINFENVALDAAESGGQSLTLDSGAFETDLGLAGFNSLLGAVTVDASLFNTSGIRTNGSEINITADTVLGIDSVIMDTTNNGSISTGADIHFTGSINSELATSNSLTITAGSGGTITFSADIGTTTPPSSFSILSGLNVLILDVLVNDNINIIPHLLIDQSVTEFVSNLNGDIYLGDIDGTTNSAQTLKVSTGSGLVSLGVIGAGAVLNEVIVSTGKSATIHSITVSGSIEIDIPIILAASSTLSTIGDGSAGSSITFKSINGTSVGGESFTVKTGVGDIAFTDQVGYLIAPGNLDITGNTIEFETNLVSAAGTHSYHSPVTIAQSMVFRALGDITFDTTVEPLSVEPNLVLYPGGGTLTFAASIGDSPFGVISVFNAGGFYAQDIVAKSLVVAGGLPSIYLEGDITLSGLGGIVLDGGPINLGGEIAATHIWFRSYGSISNLDSSQAINISGDSPFLFEYLNAIGGNIGSASSPIKINTTHQSNLGANYRADFEGEPFHGIFLSIPSNPPCIVTFNGIILLDCNSILSPQENFNLIPKNLWYSTWLYSSWDNLSNPEFFTQESSNLGADPRDLTMFYRKALLYKTDPLIENSILDLEKRIPQNELADWKSIEGLSLESAKKLEEDSTKKEPTNWREMLGFPEKSIDLDKSQ